MSFKSQWLFVEMSFKSQLFLYVHVLFYFHISNLWIDILVQSSLRQQSLTVIDMANLLISAVNIHFPFERMKKSNQDPRKGRKLYQWRRIVINQPTSGPPCQGPLLQRSCHVAGPLIETDLALWGPLRETEGRYLQFLYGDNLRQQWFYCEVFHFIGKWATFYLR